MQKDSGREQSRRHIAKVNDFIEPIQLAGVMERAQDERNQAQNIEMARLMGAAAPEIDE